MESGMHPLDATSRTHSLLTEHSAKRNALKAEDFPVFELTREEFDVSVLLESHSVACQALYDIALSAVKHCNPVTWKDKICECFGATLRSHVKDRLNTSCLFTDIYPALKILRCCVHDVARFCRGSLSEQSHKEQFCLQVHGVETARTWALSRHGESASVLETYASVGLLVTICETLNIQDQSMIELKRLLSYTSHQTTDYNQCQTPGPQNIRVYMFSVKTLRRTLLYKCLEEFEREFCKHFHEADRKQNKTCGQEEQVKVEHICDLPSLVKSIWQEVAKPRKEILVSLQRLSNETVNFGAACKNVLAARNKLAHNEELLPAEINQILLSIYILFRAFSLIENSEKRGLYVERFAHLTDRVANMACQAQLDPGEEIISCNKENHQRMLFARGQYYVGREKEMEAITTFFKLQNQHTRTGNEGASAVLLFGPPGIGKTYLALKVCQRLRNLYPRQAWLSMSDEYNMANNLFHNNTYPSCKVDSEHPPSYYKNSLKASEDFEHAQSGCKSATVISSTSTGSLYMLDDISLSKIHIALQTFVKNRYPLIITTRCTAVKEVFQQMIMPLQIFRLQEFTTAESLELVRMKTAKNILTDRTLALVKKVAKTVLRNLPLCVNIFSNLVAVADRQKSKWHPADIGEMISPSTWTGIEEEFGDRLHVRGLTVVETYLKDHPLAVLLLNKICLANSESVLWKIVSETVCGNSKDSIKITGISSSDLRKFSSRVSGRLLDLCEMIHRIFSENGQGTLQTCRNALEELGLITWNSKSATVHIHRLTQESVREVMMKRRLDSLVACAAGRCSEDNKSNESVHGICQYMNFALLSQMVHKSLQLIDDVGSSKEMVRDAEKYSAALFLQTLLDNDYPFSSVGSTLPLHQLHKMQSVLIKLSPMIKYNLRFPLSVMDIVALTKVENKPPHMTLLQNMMERKNSSPTVNTPVLEQVLVKQRDLYGQSSYEMARGHCGIAEQLERREGPHSRNSYLLRSSRTCPRLMMEPTLQQLMGYLLNIRAALCAIQDGEQVDMTLPVCTEITWQYLVQFRLRDAFQGGGDGGKDKSTLACGLVLMHSLQLKQLFFLEKIKPKTADQEVEKMRCLVIYSELVRSAVDEGSLWDCLHCWGRQFRALVKTFAVLREETLDRMCNTLQSDPWRQQFWMSYQLERFINECCQCSSFLGHHSLTSDVIKTVRSKVHNKLPTEQILQNISLEPKHEANFEQSLEPFLHLRPDFLLFEITSSLYAKKSLHHGVIYYPRLLILTHAWYKVRQTDLTLLSDDINDCAWALINEIMFLSALLGKINGQDLHKTIEHLADDHSTPERWKEAIRYRSVKMARLCEATDLHSTYTYFLAARDAIDKSQFNAAHQAGVKCWRNVLQILIFFDQTWIPDVFLLLVWEITNSLKQVNVAREKYDIAEWFAKFRVHFAKNHGMLYLAAVRGVEYVKFLRERERWSDALKQCSLVECNLVEDFGDDYLEWLPDAPNAAALRKELEKRHEGTLARSGSPAV